MTEQQIGATFANLKWDWIPGIDTYEVLGRQVGLSGYLRFRVENVDSMLTLILKPNTTYEWTVVPVINGQAGAVDPAKIRQFTTLPESLRSCDNISGFTQTETEIIFTCTINENYIIHTFMVASATVVNGVITPVSGMDIVQIKRADLLNSGTQNPDYLNNPNGTYIGHTTLSEGNQESTHEVRFTRPLSGKIWVMIAATPGLNCDGVIIDHLFDA